MLSTSAIWGKRNLDRGVSLPLAHQTPSCVCPRNPTPDNSRSINKLWSHYSQHTLDHKKIVVRISGQPVAASDTASEAECTVAPAALLFVFLVFIFSLQKRAPTSAADTLDRLHFSLKKSSLNLQGVHLNPQRGAPCFFCSHFFLLLCVLRCF